MKRMLLCLAAVGLWWPQPLLAAQVTPPTESAAPSSALVSQAQEPAPARNDAAAPDCPVALQPAQAVDAPAVSASKRAPKQQPITTKELFRALVRAALVAAHFPAFLLGLVLTMAGGLYAFNLLLDPPPTLMLTLGTDGVHGSLAPPFLLGLLGGLMMGWALLGTLMALGVAALS